MPKVLGEHGRQHDVRGHRRVTAENAIDLGPLQPGIGNRKLGRLAHEIERGRPLVLAIGRQSNAGDEAHGSLTTSLIVIPGRSEGRETRNLEIPGSSLRIAPE